MKKILVFIFIMGVTVPSLVWANIERPGGIRSGDKRPQREQLQLMHDTQLNNSNLNIPKKNLPQKDQLGPKKKLTNSEDSLNNTPLSPQPSLPSDLQQKPKDLASGLEQHAKAIELKLSHLDESQIPEDKRDLVREDMESELAWIQAMQAKLAEAQTDEEQAALMQETREHLQQQREKRGQKLAQAAQLPAHSPFLIAQTMGERMQNLLDHLQTQEVDTAELAQAIADYQQAVSDGQTLFDSLSEDKSYDQLVAVRDQLMLVKDKGQTVRNLLQSLLKPAE